MSVNIRTIKDIRSILFHELKNTYPEEEIRSLANIIIKTIIGITKLHALYTPDEPVNPQQANRISEICTELKTGKPIQYILGETTFYDCTIRLRDSTLIPRPETEELTDLIIKENRHSAGSLLDIGTGSGCIAIALAKNIPELSITGIDISQAAISVAQENADINNVKVSFIVDDIFKLKNMSNNKFDIIVSNPPYVRNSEKLLMSRNVLDFEPHSALFVDDADPLKYYQAIMNIAQILLNTGGKLYFEINEALGKDMIQLLESGDYLNIELIKDLNSKDRIIKAIKNG